MRIVAKPPVKIDDALLRKSGGGIERPGQFVADRIGIVLIGKTEAGHVCVDGLKGIKLRSGAQHRHLARDQGSFDAPGKTGTNRKKLIRFLDLEIRANERFKKRFPQTLESEFPVGLVRRSVRSMPARKAV